MKAKLFSQSLREHFVRTTLLKKFTLKESQLLAQKTNDSASINAKEAYQQFNYEEEPITSQEPLKGRNLAECFESFCE
jgi:hypothetical protein